MIISIIAQGDDKTSSKVQEPELNISDDQLACEPSTANLKGNYSEEVDAATWNSHGNRASEYGDYDKSLKLYSIAILSDPNFVDPWNNKGIVLFYKGCKKESIKRFDRAIKMDPKKDIPWANKGEALYRMGMDKEALNCTKKAIELNPKNAVAWNCMGNTLAKLNNYEEALHSYNRSIDSNIYYSKAWNNKAIALSKMGRYNESRECFWNAAALNQNTSGMVVANYGLALREMGENEKAELAFAEAKAKGYNATVTDYILQSEFIFMEDPKSIPWPGGLITAIGMILIVRILRRGGTS